MNSRKIGVLGGGLSGLTLGYLLKARDENVMILEKENEVGGLLRSMEREGYTFDTGGSHIIFSKNDDVLDFMLDLLGII